jgi:hypothetical protein
MNAMMAAASVVCAFGMTSALRPPTAPDASEVFVTVLDGRGAAVSGLASSDFLVTVDGTTRDVTAAQQATGPLAAVVIVDGFFEANTLRVRETLRDALHAFAGAGTDVRVAFLFGDAGPVPPLTSVRSDRAALDQVIHRFVRSGTSSPLLESVQQAARALASVPETRRAIFVLTNPLESPASGLTATEVARDLREARTSLWGLQTSRPRTALLQEHEVLLRKVSRESGGQQHLSSTPMFGGLFLELVGQALSQYRVTFAAPASTAQGVLRVGVRRDDVVVLAPGWFK